MVPWYALRIDDSAHTRDREIEVWTMEVFQHWIDDFHGCVPSVLRLQRAVLGWEHDQNPTSRIISEGSAPRTVYFGAGMMEVSA